MKQFTTLMLLFICTGQLVFSQPDHSEVKQRYIEVTGYAEKEVTPNEVYLGIRLQEYMKDKNTKVTMAMLENDLAGVLKQAGLSKDDLKVNSLNTDLQKFHKRRDEDVFAQTYYQLKVTDMSKLGPFMEALGETDIKQVYVERTDHSEIEDFKLEVKTDAVKNAQKKADALLKAAGEKSGNVLFIIEAGERITYDPIYDDYGYRHYKKTDVINYMDDEDKSLVTSEFRPIQLTYTVKVRFAIQE